MPEMESGERSAAGQEETFVARINKSFADGRRCSRKQPFATPQPAGTPEHARPRCRLIRDTGVPGDVAMHRNRLAQDLSSQYLFAEPVADAPQLSRQWLITNTGRPRDP
jgi:hypothetical protein